MMYFELSSAEASLSSDDLRQGLCKALNSFGTIARMLIVPPDITRFHSRAGEITRYAYEHNPEAVRAIVPALGTHQPMNSGELTTMFGDIPQRLFVAHGWRTDCIALGDVPKDFIEEVSGGLATYSIPVTVNKLLLDPSLDCILSISQVVPHEVAGMAGYSKNIFVGLGGAENIHKSHFLGAAYGMERILGRAETPVRRVFDYAVETYLRELPIIHVITVIGREIDGSLAVRGLFIGNDRECFLRAAELSRIVNITTFDKRIGKIVVYLDPREYKSTWLGNKSIYRTRMAIADGGELVVMAPGVRMFGEDSDIDRCIRQFGYNGTPVIMRHVIADDALRNNLSAAAHLIHGSSEGRFTVTYAPGGLTREEIVTVGFVHASVDDMLSRYDPDTLSEGYNRLPDGEEIFFISNPGIGLWASRESV